MSLPHLLLLAGRRGETQLLGFGGLRLALAALHALLLLLLVLEPLVALRPDELVADARGQLADSGRARGRRGVVIHVGGLPLAHPALLHDGWISKTQMQMRDRRLYQWGT